MKTLVVPIAATEPTTNTLTFTGLLAQALDAEIELIHVVAPSQFVNTPSSGPPSPEQLLKRVRSTLPDDLSVHIVVESGDPVEQVQRRVHQLPNALLVIPSRGRGALSRAIFGSVSDQIVRTSRIPVIVTRETMRFPRQALGFIVVPLDSSRLSESAVPFALSLAKRTDATIILLSVIDTSQIAAYAGIEKQSDLIDELEDETRDLARSYLDEIGKRLRSEGVRVMWEVRQGRPADEIVRAAETTNSDLIVMSTHGRRGIQRWAFGSVTDDVIQRGNTPVFVVPAGDHRE